MLIKADFHIHTGDDPYDFLPYTNFDVVDRAVEKGLSCVAIANHDKFSWSRELADYAEAKKVLLVPAIETQIHGKDLIILNADKASEKLKTDEDFFAYKTPGRFYIAPHPFYPIKYSFNELTEKYSDLFDAVEISSCYLWWFNKYNKLAEKFAEKHNLPLVCDSDAHGLWQVGSVWSEIEAEEFTIQSVFKAIREKRVKLVSRPMSAFGFFRFYVWGGYSRALKRMIWRGKRER